MVGPQRNDEIIDRRNFFFLTSIEVGTYLDTIGQHGAGKEQKKREERRFLFSRWHLPLCPW
jgi:hypothetical protein